MAARKTKKRTNAPRVSAKSVRQALQDHGGNVSAVADAFGRSRQTVYNWIMRYQLRDLVELSRDQMFSTAEDNINLAVQAGNLEASKFVLTHMPVAERWSSRSEHIVSPLGLSDEVIGLMEKLGIRPEELTRNLEEMIREQAADE